MEFTLTETSAEELPRMMQIIVDAWKEDKLWAPLAKDTSYDDQIQWWIDCFKAGFAEPFHRYFKIIDDNTGKLAAWTCLQVPAPQTDDYKERSANGVPGPAKGMNVELLGVLSTWLSMGIPNGYDPEKHFHRRGTFVDPAYQKQGLGTRLTKHCNIIADAAGGRTFVPAGPNSKHMFEQNGFTSKDTFNVDMDKYGGADYKVEFWLHIREPDIVSQ